MAWDYDYTDGADIIDAMADEWEYCCANNEDDEDIALAMMSDEDIPF